MVIPDRFLFRGHAVGAAATVRRMEGQALQKILVTQAASSLPVNGGRSQQTLTSPTDPGLNPFLSFQTACTYAEGKFDSVTNANVTEVNAAITGLRLAGGRFTADQLQARLLSIHPGGGRQPSISWAGTSLTGLKLEGHDVEVTLDQVLAPLTCEDDLVREYAKPPFYNTHCKRFFERPGGGHGPGKIPRIGRGDGYIGISIVDSIRTDCPGVQIDGHKLTLQGFGTLYFGEMIISPDSKRLTLIRFELGCPEEGDGDVGDVMSNGESIP
jgi:hypothetical protein